MVGLVVLAVVLAAAAPASAVTVPGERPADARLSEQVVVAVEYWTARGVVGCPSGIRASFVPDLRTEDGSGFAAGHGYQCEVWIDAGLAHDVRLPGRPWRAYNAALECAIVVHEVGHALGLVHAPEGVMRADVAGRWELVPVECWAWARRWLPRPRRPHVRVAFGALR